MNRIHVLSNCRKPVMFLAGVLLLLPVSSCAVFRLRAQRWESSVTRDPDGVLSHARARTWEADGPSVLLVHGFGDGPHVWNSLGPELTAKGFYVRALRLPGWNEPLEVKRTVTREDWRDQVLQEADSLQSRNQPLVVMAHSLGGCIVADLVQSGHLRPDALVLYAPLFRVSNARSPVFSSRTWFKIGRRVLPDAFIVESVFQEQAQHRPPRPPEERDPYNPKEVFIQIFELMNEREALPVVATCPVLLVVAEGDRVINTPVALDWFAALQAPSKTLRTDPEAGHVLPLDLDPASESEQLLLWLQEQEIQP